MTLPTQKSPPKGDASRKFFLLYGRSKIGKSTFASKAPGGIFVATDPGLDEIECFRVPEKGVCATWEEFLGYVDEICRSDQFKTLIIDTIDVAWDLYADSLCKKNKVEYFNDGTLGYGKGRVMILNEFRRLILRLKTTNLGLILISHAIGRPEETSPDEIRWYPSLPKKAGEDLSGLVDAILFADFDAASNSRVIRLHNSSRYQAGCRGGTYLPEKWPLDDYPGFLSAYSESLQKNAENGGKPQPKPVVPPTVKAPAVRPVPAVATAERRTA